MQVENLEQEKIKLTEDLEHAYKRLKEDLEMQQLQYFQVCVLHCSYALISSHIIIILSRCSELIVNLSKSRK